MVLGIVGLLSLFLPLLTPASIIALVLGSSARKKLTAAGAETGTATAGFVMGVVGIALGALAALVWTAAVLDAIEKEKKGHHPPPPVVVVPWSW
jgi:hypothetical protein